MVPEVDPDFIMHKLNMDPSFPLKKRKRENQPNPIMRL